MEYELFVQNFTEQLQLNMEDLGLNPTIERMQVHEKINGVQDTLTAHFDGMEAAPVIYLQGAYEDFQNGVSIEELADGHSEGLLNFYEHPPIVPELTEELARENIFCSVINAELNEELLQGVPHEKMLDLAVIPKLRYGESSIVVTDGLCEHFHLTGEEVMEIAEKNTEAKGFVCKDLREMLGIPKDEIPTDAEGLLYVMTNEEAFDGAIAITSKDALSKACAEIGEEVFVLPASRHEIILVPNSMAPEDVSVMQDMVKMINRTELNPRDFLSDNVYFFNGRELSIATQKALETTKDTTKEIAKAVKNTITRR